MRPPHDARDPWTYIAAALVGGLAWAVGASAPAAVSVAALVATVRVATGTALERAARPALGRHVRSAPTPPPLPTAEATPEGVWLGRATRAVDRFDRLARSIPDRILSERTRSMTGQAREALERIRGLCGQTSTTRSMQTELDERRLVTEEAALTARREQETDDEVRAELDRSLASIAHQRHIAERLARSLEQLLVRIGASVLDLERLVAQLAEVLAASDRATQTAGADQLEALAEQLDGLRAGLEESERISRRALGGSIGAPPAPALPRIAGADQEG